MSDTEVYGLLDCTEHRNGQITDTYGISCTEYSSVGSSELKETVQRME